MAEQHDEVIPTGDESSGTLPDPPMEEEGDRTSAETEDPSLEAATRLVEPGRFNNLTPDEISSRHLFRARREMHRTCGGLQGLQHDSQRLIARARGEAQTGQQIARLAPGRRRAHRIRRALRRAADLHARYDSLQDERNRFSRKIAAARDVLEGWNSTSRSRLGQPLARSVSRNILTAARTERMTRERLDEAERALHHLDAAEEAMRRDSEALRLDPVTFRRFAGRTRWSVRLAVLVILLGLVAVLYPPWAPPHLTAGCGGASSVCTNLSTADDLQVVNHGDGLLIGWLTITVQFTAAPTSTQVVPLVLLPRSARTLTCGDLGICALSPGSTAHVQITSSGGSVTVPVG